MDSVAPRVTRAAVWTGAGIDVREVDIPELLDGELLVRIRLATVCGSDLHTVSGRRKAPCPSVLGHEAVGDVVAVGAGAAARVGQRIVWSVTVGCGQCARCRSGRTAKCLFVRKTGHEGFDGDWPLSGGYAEHIVLPKGIAVAEVPHELTDAVAAQAACATATVMATLDPAGTLVGHRVLICGAGLLGVTAAAACADAGAEVSITDIDPHRLELARRFGGVPDDGGPVDVAIDYTGATSAVGNALTRLDVGGVLILAGSVLPGPSLAVDPEAVVRGWLTITGVHNYEPHHLFAAVRFLARTRDVYPWASIVSEPVGLEAISEALGPTPSGVLRSAVRP